jgi:GAF domain-containing protein/anti-sigma regulatory factor (Ser/Thr protein kinase)
MQSVASTGGGRQELSGLDSLRQELNEAREQQRATTEILSVISRSPRDVQPVFDAIVANAARLCDAAFSAVVQFRDGLLHLVAVNKMSAEETAAYHTVFPRSPNRGFIIGRAFLDGRPVHVADIEADPFYDPLTLRILQAAAPYRTYLGIPIIRDGVPIGAIGCGRREVKPYSDAQIALVKTFADQAVIAIENARLFEEVQTRTRELSEALEQQTATSEVLSVISSSPGELEAVFQAILENAVRICDARYGNLWLCEGDRFRLVTAHNPPVAWAERWQHEAVISPGPGTGLGRVARTRQVVHISDVSKEPAYLERDPLFVAQVELAGGRTLLVVPLLKHEDLIGTIGIYRQEVRPFSDRQIELLKGFANQAVIAIENTRLLKELRESLQQQTATADVLNVISRSPTEVQPVFDAIVASAAELCRASRSNIQLYDGQQLHVVATHNFSPEANALLRQMYPMSPNRSQLSGRAILSGSVVHVSDVLLDPDYAQDMARTGNLRALLSVPMLRDGAPIGVITVSHSQPTPFSKREIELLKTFADQAVIAIANTRLFEEVQARNRDLTALGEVGRAVSSTLDLKAVLKSIVERAVELSGTDAGSIFYYREQLGRFELGETTGLDENVIARFRRLDIAAKDTGLGEAIAIRQPLPLPDLTKRPNHPLRDAAIDAGLRASLIVPLLSPDGPLGTLVLQRRHPGDFPQAVINLMQTFADQSAIALENARLFEEIAQKSREVEIASQHKSQFVANMSHELRTPLAAILGFAELMQEGFYEPLGQKSLDALTRIRSNGKHLLGLINTVLDIAKIESGQFNLNLGEYALDSVVETVRAATEALAETKKLILKTEVAQSLPIGLGDEQRLTQVLLNLVGNAIKFTDAGEVRIAARAVNGQFAVSVADTGPGIPQEHQARIFEQFHQVDSSNTKAKGGTGLGLAIAREIVEMHGGRIWVESTLGKGSTFRMELPVRAANARAPK